MNQEDTYPLNELEDDYANGYEQGWQDCHKRFEAILKRFPLQCAMITNRLPLHPSQPDQILEP